MKILFLTHYFPPEVNAPASRTYEHCRVWVEHGHKISVLTCAPNHPGGKVYLVGAGPGEACLANGSAPTSLADGTVPAVGAM